MLGHQCRGFGDRKNWHGITQNLFSRSIPSNKKARTCAGFFAIRLVWRDSKPEEWIGRRDWIRTSDLLVPNETRYQAALHSDMGPNFTEKTFLRKG